MLTHKQFKTYPKGLSSLLPYSATLASGVVLLKDGSLIAAFEHQGQDIASLTPRQRNEQSRRLNQIITNFGAGGWSTQHDLIRKPSAEYPELAESAYPDPISRAIELEQRAKFLKAGNHYESTNILVVRYKPTVFQNPKIKSLIYSGGLDYELQSSLESQLEDFERSLQNFEDAMSTLFRMRRLKSYSIKDSYGQLHLRDDLVNYINYAITGEYHPVNLPPCSMYLSEYIGGQDLIPGNTPKIGDLYTACISLTGMPSESFPNILEVLNHLPLAYRWSTRMVYLDTHEAISTLKKRSKEWVQQAYNPIHQLFRISSGVVNQDAVHMTMDTQGAITDVHSGQMAFGYCTQVVVLMDEDRQKLIENARFATREIKRLGFNCRIETVNALESWLGTLPGHIVPNLRRPLVHSKHLANMIPTTTIWTGHEHAPNPLYPPDLPPLMHTATTGSTPFRLNLHVGDVGHTMVLGPTGAGKSTFLAMLAAQFRRYSDATIVSFDKGRSMWALVEACGGQHYDIGGDSSSLSFAPLSVLDTDQDMNWAIEWIASIYEIRTSKIPTAKQAQEIHRAMRLLRETKGPNERSLSDFVLTLQQSSPEDDLKEALKTYTMGGPYGAMLDVRKDTLTGSSFTVFEIEELMAMKERIAIPVLLYLFRRFERSLQGQPALLLLDEAWVMLGHPVFREKIRQWLKELRKKNCAVVLATQSLSDAVQSKIYDVLIESCPTKILLPNEEADKLGTSEYPGPYDLYCRMGLNDTEIQIIKTATKKKEYYFISPEGRRLFDLGLGPVALSFVAVSDKEKLAYLRQLKTNHGQNWPYVWLQERGISYETLVS